MPGWRGGLAQVPINVASRGLMPGAHADWLERWRRELDDLRLQALEIIGRAGLALGGGQLASVERAARTLIDAAPYRESGHVLLMEAFRGQGNIAEGLRVFERLRTLLRDELGTAPSPGALAAHQRLLHPDARRVAAEPGDHPAADVPLPAELAGRSALEMVGREVLLGEIADWLARADGERSERLLLLSGDAGVGKSRLLAEAASQAHAGGAVVLAGRAPDETLVPFQPFLAALRHYVASIPASELPELASRHGPELARLIPELGRRLPELGPAAAQDSETERYRLFEAVVELLGELAARAPVVLVLDDLHWADRPTLMLLRHIARVPRTERVSILGAFRRSERDHEGFAAALGGLRDERLVRLREVPGLSRSEAAQLVSARAGATPSLAFTQALYEETEGNPFLIEEIVRHLADSGVEAATAGAHELRAIGLPEDVQEVITRRLTRLGDDALETLRVAAVIGRDFDADLLERVLDLGEERFLAGTPTRRCGLPSCSLTVRSTSPWSRPAQRRRARCSPPRPRPQRGCNCQR